MRRAWIQRLLIGLSAAVLLLGCAANRLHNQGMDEVERGEFESGVAKLAQAVSQSPDNLAYRLDLAAQRAAAVQRLIAHADQARADNKLEEATATYRRVLIIEPLNQLALHGIDGVQADRRHAQMVAEALKSFDRKDFDGAESILREVIGEDGGYAPAVDLAARINLARGPVTVTPRLKAKSNSKVSLQFRDAPTKMVFEVLARQTGINFIMDRDVKSDGKTTIFVQDVPIEQAIELVLEQNNLSRQILSDNMVMIYPNTPAKQKDYEEQIIHTFYLTNAVPKDVESMLKSMLGAKTLYIDERTNTVVMRDTPDAVRMAEKLVASIDAAEPEVIIDVEVLEIARSRLLNLGISYPSAVTATPSPLTNGTGLVLGDLHKQNPDTINISSLSATLTALQTNGNTNTLASPRIRVRNKEKAKILIGSRVPVITNSVTPTATSAVVTGSVQYLDIGLTLEAQPTIYMDGDVAIKLGLEVSSIINQITTPSGTIAYTIGTRNANTLIRLKDGETQILAGLIQDSDTKSASGIPGFSQIPVIGRLFGLNNADREKSEIVLSVTPRIVRTQSRAASDATEFWYGTETRARLSPFAAISFGAAGGAGSVSGGPDSTAAGPVGPRVSVAQPVTPQPAAQAIPLPAPPQASTEAPPKPTVSIDGPTETSVGQEFDVTVRMATDLGISRLRGQVRFEASALQLISASAGEIVPASAGSPTVDPRSGGAQLDVVAGSDVIQGEGSLMLLRFKALAARPASSIIAQVSAMGPNGAAIATMASPALNLTIKAP